IVSGGATNCLARDLLPDLRVPSIAQGEHGCSLHQSSRKYAEILSEVQRKAGATIVPGLGSLSKASLPTKSNASFRKTGLEKTALAKACLKVSAGIQIRTCSNPLKQPSPPRTDFWFGVH